MTRPMLETRNVERRFVVDGGLFKTRRVLHAVNGVSLTVRRARSSDWSANPAAASPRLPA